METREILENLYIDIDLDGEGNLVCSTIEHAKKKANSSAVFIFKWAKSLYNKSFE